MIQILIIEDEAKTAKELKLLVEEFREDMRVAAILPSVKSSIKWLTENPTPDLIFSDIQLADGLSFEIFRQLPVAAPVIFCTAFDEYAIQAFDANGIDYLLKPIDEDKLRRALSKFDKINFRGEPQLDAYKEQISRLLEQMKKPYKNSLLIHFQDKIIPVSTANIAFIHSEGGIVTIHTTNHQHYYINHTLETLETMLNPALFYKANRQFIINRNAIVDIEHYFTRRLVVKLSQPTPETVIVSKVRASDFLRWVEEN